MNETWLKLLRQRGKGKLDISLLNVMVLQTLADYLEIFTNLKFVPTEPPTAEFLFVII